MTIQISLILWTVICFAVLYFVLKTLLLKPLAEVTRRRNEKMAEARRRTEEAEHTALEAAKVREAESQREAENRRVALERETEIAAKEGKAALEAARKARVETVGQYREQIERETETDLNTARENMQSVADQFLSRLYAEG